MISKTVKCLALCSISAFLSACAYTKIQVPMDSNFERTQLGSKEGRSHTTTLLYLVSWGDGGTKAAADDGNIKIIMHADREIYSILFGLYTKITTVVYGD